MLTTSHVFVSGSSPRGRGKFTERGYEFVGLRLIPAWAGKTRPHTMCQVIPPAHPRVGGENSAKKWGARPTEGSSPRGRGKPSP